MERSKSEDVETRKAGRVEGVEWRTIQRVEQRRWSQPQERCEEASGQSLQDAWDGSDSDDQIVWVASRRHQGAKDDPKAVCHRRDPIKSRSKRCWKGTRLSHQEAKQQKQEDQQEEKQGEKEQVKPEEQQDEKQDEKREPDQDYTRNEKHGGKHEEHKPNQEKEKAQELMKRLRTPPRRPQYFDISESLNSDTNFLEDCEINVQKGLEEGSFGAWLCEHRPLLRFEHMSVGLAWDFPLAKSEKREMLVLHMAVAEDEAMKVAKSSPVVESLVDTTSVKANSMSRFHRLSRRLSGRGLVRHVVLQSYRRPKKRSTGQESV